jgi:hypothetical protein
MNSREHTLTTAINIHEFTHSLEHHLPSSHSWEDAKECIPQNEG